MKYFLTIRGIAVFLVLLSLFLPLSRCSHKMPPPQGDSQVNTVTEQSAMYDYRYARDWFSLTEWEGWLTIIAFTWPFLMIVVHWRLKNIKKKKILRWVEIVLSLCSIYLIWELSSVGERLAGAYCAISGMGLYFISVIWDPLRSLCLSARNPGCE